ncbi:MULTISPECIES: NlpC/P60 family protein [Paenibacillus]|uniref:C40 family peptidase n=1 Tax=Paenibacillus TaxID=44249 RepID=UPI002FE1538B
MSIAPKKTWVPLLLGLLLLAATACGNQQPGPAARSVPKPENPLMRTGPEGTPADNEWIPLTQVADSLGLRLKESQNSAQMGFTDVMFELTPSQRSAISFGKQVTLAQPPLRQNGKTYLTAAALSDLLQGQVSKNPKTGELHIASVGGDQAPNVAAQPRKRGFQAFGLAENRDELISYARQFLGVPYEFGAAPYEQSNTFDCSSFTRHVFKRFGIDLHRLARDQAKQGTPVERSELLPGDLIFFTVPGRFDSEKIPGHVGIYIGNGKFIHTWGDPGVQISSLDSGYWNDVILSMRRVQ